MASFQIVVRKDKKDQAGTIPVYLRIMRGDKSAYLSLSTRVPLRDWSDAKGEVRKSGQNARQINRHLQAVLADAQAALARRTAEREPVTARLLKRDVGRMIAAEEASDFDFLAYCRERLALIEADGRISTYRNHRTAVNKLEAFQRKRTGRARLPITDLTPAYLEAFMAYVGKGVRQNTVHKNMRALRSFTNDAIRDGHMSRDAYPFREITMKRERSIKHGLTREEMERVERLELRPGTNAYHVRNMWLLSTYLQGMRWGDVLALRWDNLVDGRVVYRMGKTGSVKSVLLHDDAARVVDLYAERRGGHPYIFPLLDRYRVTDEESLRAAVASRNVIANRLLKEIAKAAEVDKRLTTHVARHTFASLALDRGWTLKELQKSLGHKHISTTEAYVHDLRDDALDEKMNDLF